MSSHEPKIRPLPPDVAAKIKSSTSIIHLNGVIVELVKNALDANAQSVYVTVDFQRGGCVVEDDGDGIPSAEFESGGGLGKAHHTSKYYTKRDVYGRRGLFLASLASLSLLTVISRYHADQHVNTVIFHHSTPVTRLVPAPAQQLRFSNHGTSVTVNDLFGNMPVRVKSRALALQKPDELEKEWDDLRQLLVALMLANDSFTRLVMTDASRNRRITIHPRHGPRNHDELNLRRISSILAQASLINFQTSRSWNAVSACLPDLSIHAAISLIPSPTRKVQFISLGMESLFSQDNTLYGEINRIFAASDFGTGATELLPAEAKAMAKAVNKWPMFYIRIETSGIQKLQDDQVSSPESDNTIKRIMDVLSAMINEFLKQHNLRPRAGKRKRQMKTPERVNTADPNETMKSKADRRGDLLNTEDIFDSRLKLPSFQKAVPNVSQDLGSWSRIKGAKEEPTQLMDSNLIEGSRMMRNHKPAVSQDPATPTQDMSLGRESPCLSSLEDEATENDSGDAIIPWKDPHTGRTHLINSRTGQSVDFTSSIDAASRSQSTGSTVRALNSRLTNSATPSAQNQWVENLLKGWNNPTFGRLEKPIESLEVGSELDRFKSHDCSGSCGLESFGMAKFKGKLRKNYLERAEVVSQVDQKFILAKLVAGDEGFVLALIDQHAADERCRVERLFEELWDNGQVQSVGIDPISFGSPLTEAPLLRRGRGFFSSWGVQYRVEQSPKGVFVSVYTLPTLIAERCRTEPHLVIDLIRGELWKREENGKGQDFLVQTGNWVERIGGCPQGIIDLLNSRACRTAVMFNDVLTVDECQNLVSRLARCVFPFQCAHGRPSMVPILDMQIDFGQASEFTGQSFCKAFRSSTSTT